MSKPLRMSASMFLRKLRDYPEYVLFVDTGVEYDPVTRNELTDMLRLHGDRAVKAIVSPKRYADLDPQIVVEFT